MDGSAAGSFLRAVRQRRVRRVLNDVTVVTATHMFKRLAHPELGHLVLACDARLDPHRDHDVVMFSIIDGRE